MSSGICATAAWAPMKKSGNTPVRLPPRVTITPKHLTGEKQRRPRYFNQLKSDVGENAVGVLDTRVTDRELSIHY